MEMEVWRIWFQGRDSRSDNPGERAERVGQANERARMRRRQVHMIHLKARRRQTVQPDRQHQQRHRRVHIASDIAQRHQTHRRQQLPHEMEAPPHPGRRHEAAPLQRVRRVPRRRHHHRHGQVW